MLELAARPSHYAHFCALSRYGVTTERPDLRPTCVGLFSVASGMLGLRLASGLSGCLRILWHMERRELLKFLALFTTSVMLLILVFVYYLLGTLMP
jgi:hypothetical protein